MVPPVSCAGLRVRPRAGTNRLTVSPGPALRDHPRFQALVERYAPDVEH